MDFVERTTLRQRISDIETEQLIVDGHISDLQQQIQREQSEFDLKLSNAKESLTTADIRAREVRTSFAQTERALLSSQKNQIQTLADMTRESILNKANEQRQELSRQISALQTDVEELSKEKDRVLEENIKILKDVGGIVISPSSSSSSPSSTEYSGEQQEQQQMQNNQQPIVARFMHKLLNMRNGWREHDIKAVSRFIREEVHAALTDLDHQRHTKFVNDKAQRTKQLQRHYSDRNSDFNSFRVKRATVNDEHRQQTVSSVRDRASATAKKVAGQMKEHVASIEKMMEGEAASAHKELRRTMETLMEQRRSYVASEETENKHKIVTASTQNKQEREQLNQRLKSELDALRRAKVLIGSGTLRGKNEDEHEQNNGGMHDVTTNMILSEWFKTNKVKLQQEATRIHSSAESSLGQIRGQVAHLRQQQQHPSASSSTTASNSLRPLSFFERYDELRSQLDIAKSSCKDSWSGLKERIGEFTHRVLENVESLSGGVLRCEVVAQSQEAERVRQEWERELRRRMSEESLLFLGGGSGGRTAGSESSTQKSSSSSTVNTHQIISQMANTLALRLQKSRDMMQHLRSTRSDSLSSILAETEHVSSTFEEVLLATTKLLDTCPELARVSTKAQFLQEIVERDEDQVEEEKEYVKQVRKHKKRVKEMIDHAGPLLVGQKMNSTNENQQQHATERHGEKYHETTIRDDEDNDDDNKNEYAHKSQQHQTKNRYKPMISSVYEASRTSSKLKERDSKNNIRQRVIPSQKAREDPFVIQRMDIAAAKTNRTVPRVAVEDDDDERSFEPLIEFSDDGSSQASGARIQSHQQQQQFQTPIYHDTTQPRQQHQQKREGSTASTTATTTTTISSNQQHQQQQQQFREPSPQPVAVVSSANRFSASSPSSFIQQAQQLQQRFGHQHQSNNGDPHQVGGYLSAGSMTTPTPDEDEDYRN